MTYQEALAYLDGLIDFEKVGASYFGADRFQLSTVRRLLGALGNPQQRLACLHIAGTKGKGSTAAMADSILRACGFRVGLFTKPHLIDIRERVRLDSRMISRDDFARLVEQIKPAIHSINAEPGQQGITFYEALVALALCHFEAEGTDFAVIEAGLGGQLDATNVLEPRVCAITRIDFDHMELLGNSLREIAAEKAGILKAGVPCVVAPQEPEAMAPIVEHAAAVGAPLRAPAEVVDQGAAFGLRLAGELFAPLQVPLHGQYQRLNAATALAMVDALGPGAVPLRPERVRAGLAQVRLRGRFDIVRRTPTVVLDVAHNPLSARALRETLEQMFPVLADELDGDVPAAFGRGGGDAE